MSVCEHGRIVGLKLCGICNPPTPARITIYSTPPRTLRNVREDLADTLNRGRTISRERIEEVVKDLDVILEHEESR